MQIISLTASLYHASIIFQVILEQLTLLIVKASPKKTPQPTPALSLQPAVAPVGTTQRLSSLRKACLIRDHHMCVISRQFDANEADVVHLRCVISLQTAYIWNSGSTY